MRYALPLAVLLAVVVGHHAYYWLADAGWHIGAASRAASGVERLTLYAVVAALMLWPARSVAPRAAALALAVYGLGEAAQVAVCQSARALASAPFDPARDACDALLGWPVGAVSAAVWGLALAVLAAAGLWRATRPGVPFAPVGCFTGYVPVAAGAWKVLAAVFAYPFAGKVWFADGLGYRFDRACGALVNDRTLRPADYKLRPYKGDPALLRVGLPWSLRHNCVTLG